MDSSTRSVQTPGSQFSISALMMWTTRAARPRIAPAVRSRVSTSPSCRAITHLLTSSSMWFSRRGKKKNDNRCIWRGPRISFVGGNNVGYLFYYLFYYYLYLYTYFSTKESIFLINGDQSFILCAYDYYFTLLMQRKLTVLNNFSPLM